jgi:hypothetical protein
MRSLHGFSKPTAQVEVLLDERVDTVQPCVAGRLQGQQKFAATAADIDDARVVDLNIAKEHIGNVIVLHHDGGMGAQDACDAIEQDSSSECNASHCGAPSGGQG